MQNSSKTLTRALIAGCILALLGIGLFLALFWGLGNAEVPNSQRLFVALCIPPTFIGVLLGVYALFFRKSA